MLQRVFLEEKIQLGHNIAWSEKGGGFLNFREKSCFSGNVPKAKDKG